MNDKKDEKWLDELISRAIDSGQPVFDAERWKEKYPEEFQLLKSQAQRTASVRQRNIWVIVVKSRITQVAAAVLIIIASCFFLAHQGQNGEIKTQQITQTVKSPAELTTFASFSFAYRQGGMEMVEKMCDKALKQAGQRPANISMQEFSEEINNEKSERTEL